METSAGSAFRYRRTQKERELFTGITFHGIIHDGKFFLLYSEYVEGVCEKEHCVSEEELFEIPFATNRAYEKPALPADGMKEIRKLSFFDKIIYIGNKSILGLSVRFYVVSNNPYLKNSAAYSTGETIFKGTVITSNVPTIGRLNVITNHWDLSTVQENDIVVIHELLPNIMLDLDKINGLIVEVGGRGSHSAIVTSAKGIGLIQHENAVEHLKPHDGKWVKFDVQLDANSGVVTSPPEIIGNTDYYYSEGDIASASMIDRNGNKVFITPKALDEMSKHYLDAFATVLSPDTPPEVLGKYKDHPYREIRIAVAKHENCTYEILKHLAKDRSRTLRRIVKEIVMKNSKLTNEQKRDVLETLKTK